MYENSHQAQSIFARGAYYYFMKSQEEDKADTFLTAAHKLPGAGRSSGL